MFFPHQQRGASFRASPWSDGAAVRLHPSGVKSSQVPPSKILRPSAVGRVSAPRGSPGVWTGATVRSVFPLRMGRSGEDGGPAKSATRTSPDGEDGGSFRSHEVVPSSRPFQAPHPPIWESKGRSYLDLQGVSNGGPLVV